MLEPNIYSFNDYRSYLAAFYQHQKSSKESYSYEIFSRRAHIKSPNFLKLVIDKKKNLTTKTLLQFAQALSMSDHETIFFEALVLENQADSAIEKKYYGDRVRTLKPPKMETRTVRISPKMNLFDDPLTPIILALAVGEDHENAIKKVEGQLGVVKDKIEKILRLFVQTDVIQLTGNCYKCNFNHAIFHEGPSGVQLKKYVQSHLKYIMRAFEKKYSKDAKFFVHDMALDSADYPRLVDEIKRFIHHLNQTFDRSPGERGVSINIQSFWIDSEIIHG